MSVIRLTVNGEAREVTGVATTLTVLRWLREAAGLVGTKEGCAEGDCGACTVVVRDGARFRAVDSCLIPVGSLHGAELWTAEGIGHEGAPHPAQEALAARLGSQCGYCTPGIAMSLFEATYRDDLDAAWKLDDQLCGNLCRCTGYRPILDAARDVAGRCPADRFRATLAADQPVAAVDYAAHGDRFVVPASLAEALAALASHPEARPIAGGTDLGLDITQRHKRFPVLVAIDRLPELRGITAIAGGWRIGAATPLTDVEAWADRAYVPLARMLRYYGSRQIKHRATLGGNLANASPIGDSPPVLLAADATVIVASVHGERRVGIDDLFTGYRQTALRPGELIVAVELPERPTDARFGAYKVSKRREMDISAVAAAFRVRTRDGVVYDARLAYGGMAATPARARHAEQALLGRAWDEASVELAVAALDEDFTPLSDVRGSAGYRRVLAGNLLRGFFLESMEASEVRLPDRPTAPVVLGGAS
jgi:xanthine dehydrogenase small subunit